jgi:exodeoxyribonuclease VII large subunit
MKLPELVEKIQDTIHESFEGEVFHITAEITDVKKYPDKRWCFLKFIEKENNTVTTEIKGVFWPNTFFIIENFEKQTGQSFSNGLEITCYVRVRYHKRYGLSLEVLEIDYAYSLGKIELEKQQTLERLVKENPQIIRLIDGQYYTKNNQSELPLVFSTIALITAPGSDGQRDFEQELIHNPYGYKFSVKEFLTQIQGDDASNLILQQLKLIEKEKEKFDAVAIVRGGGSQIDFRPFDDYELARCIAAFPIPVLTGIGHDRNISIVDLMARHYKTPTKVGTFIIEHNMNFESAVEELKERFFLRVEKLLENAKNKLQEIKRIVKNLSPSAIMKKGFAVVTMNGKIVVNPEMIQINSEVKTILKNQIIHSTVTKKTKNENQYDL